MTIETDWTVEASQTTLGVDVVEGVETEELVEIALILVQPKTSTFHVCHVSFQDMRALGGEGRWEGSKKEDKKRLVGWLAGWLVGRPCTTVTRARLVTI